MKYKITPSLMTCDLLNIENELTRMQEANIDWIHFDLMDGKYVNNLGLAPMLCQQIKQKFKNLTIDLHCMVNNIENILDVLTDIDYITIHFSSLQKSSFQTLFEKIKQKNIKVGIAIDLDDEFNDYSYILHFVDLITIMSIVPGFTGSKFSDKTWNTIKKLVDYRDENSTNFLLQIDGGVRNENIVKLIKNQIDLIVVGSWLFSQSDYSKRLEDLNFKIQSIEKI